ncbi:MAG TPA: HD domain-containing phosphohydrolase [Pirellulales bacterium]|nr:HD domain-containing phosphohydrolase [Pirellulales bacterium]
MLRVPVQKLQPGMVLARPVPLPNDPRRYLLQRDHEVPPDLARRLLELGVYEVWVRCRNLEFLEDLIDEELGEQQRAVYTQVRRSFEEVMSRQAAELDIGRFERTIGDLFSYLRSSPCGSVMLQKLDAFDNYLISHAANVCYLSLLLGLRLERYLIAERTWKTAREAKDLQLLGLGAMLHDVGKMKIPAEILHKPGRLTAEEMEIMRQHPTLGYQMLRGQVPAAAAQVALNHHQRYDGTGYPARRDARTGEELPPLAGKQIPIFARIATMADIYDAATAKRCYSEAKLPVQVVYELRTYCRGAFDPVIEQAFYEIIPPFPIGQIVTLSDGVEAAVVDFNHRRPFRPKVQGIRGPSGERFDDPALHEIDLALYPHLTIAGVNGVDVREFQTTPEQSNADATVSTWEAAPVGVS